MVTGGEGGEGGYWCNCEMKSMFLRELKMGMKTHRQTEKHAVLNFLSSVIFMLFCAAQKRLILQNNIIFVN